MATGILLLLGFLADSRAEADPAAREKAEWAAYEECTGERRPTRVWKVVVEDAWLRAGEAPDAPAKGLLHRGEAVRLLKEAASGNLLVKTEDDRKGYLRGEEVVEVVIPPRDSRPIEECPQPSFLRGARPPLNILPPPVAEPGPSPADLESLEVDGTPP